jgi:hypothetical protein
MAVHKYNFLTEAGAQVFTLRSEACCKSMKARGAGACLVMDKGLCPLGVFRCRGLGTFVYKCIHE